MKNEGELIGIATDSLFSWIEKAFLGTMENIYDGDFSVPNIVISEEKESQMDPVRP